MRKTLIATTALIALAPLGSGAADAATDNTFCVNLSSPQCTQSSASISSALAAAKLTGGTDLVLVGAGTYSDGPYTVGTGVTLQGAGQLSTVLTLPASANSQVYLHLTDDAVAQDLTIEMTGASSSQDYGLVLNDASLASRVTIDGPSVANGYGVHVEGGTLSSSTVTLGSSGGNRGVYSNGGGTVADSEISGETAAELSGPGAELTIVRSILHAGSYAGVRSDGGTVTVQDSLIDLGSQNATGVLATNFNNGTAPITMTLDGVTIAGGGQNATGVYVAASASGAKQNVNVAMTSSIVRGLPTDLAVAADNDGSQGGSSIATLDVSHSDFHAVSEMIGPHGLGGLVEGAGNVDVAPGFADPTSGDFHLTPGSPVVDQGDPAATTDPQDADGLTRVVDGDGDGVAVRDMGAFELPDLIAPQTRFTKKPGKQVATARVTFRFAAEPGATFQCKLDDRSWRSCSSPKTVTVTVGRHRFAVRAKDAAGNVDPTPAAFRFRRMP